MNTPATPDSPAAPPARLLLVAPDRPERGLLLRALQAPQHAVQASHDPQAVDEAPRRGVHLLLLDPRVEPARPGRTDAWWRLRRLREQHRRLPVVVLQASASATDRSVAYEMGADAVLDPQVDARELRAHVAALLRRASRPAAHTEPALRFGGWWLDPATRCLHTSAGQRITLSPAECRLLRAFLEHPRHALAREHLMDLARGAGVEQLDRSIDLLVSRLRHKLGDEAGFGGGVIRTVRGVGYLFEAAGEAGWSVSTR
ncbi:MAG: winged helix-turn-helix domain-containing protein [Pseudomonadota bacterium]